MTPTLIIQMGWPSDDVSVKSIFELKLDYDASHL